MPLELGEFGADEGKGGEVDFSGLGDTYTTLGGKTTYLTCTPAKNPTNAKSKAMIVKVAKDASLIRLKNLRTKEGLLGKLGEKISFACTSFAVVIFPPI